MKVYPFLAHRFCAKQSTHGKNNEKIHKDYANCHQKYTSISNLKHYYSINKCLFIVFFKFETLRRRALSLFTVVMRWMYTLLLQNVPLENPQTLMKDLHPGFCPERAPCCFCLPLSVAPCVLLGKKLHVNTLLLCIITMVTANIYRIEIRIVDICSK